MEKRVYKGFLSSRVVLVELLLSFGRMFAAYIVSIAVAYSVGYVLYKNKMLEKLLFPFIDILQSVPILTFFPIALYIFIHYLPHWVGPEVAVVFLIFTSMVWNIIFGVYEAFLSFPKRFRDVMRLYRSDTTAKLFRYFIPYSLKEVIPNSVVSWANGWYFLIATEIITVGTETYKLKGIGSLLMENAVKGNYPLVFIGIGAVTLLVILMNFFIWKPLLASLSLLFSGKREWNIYDYIFSHLARGKSILLGMLKRIWASIYYTVRRFPLDAAFRVAVPLVEVSLVVIFVLFVAGSLKAVWNAFQALPPSASQVVPAFLLSFGRIILAFLFSLLWTLPVAYYLYENEKAASVVVPLFEIFASIPVTALFPFLIVVLLQFTHSMEISAIVLLMTGMEWYLFFNIYGGLRSLPAFTHDVKRQFKLPFQTYLIKVVMLGILPAVVVGSMSAIGGGWNAIIVAEYLPTPQGVKSVLGIGSLMDKALYETGSMPLLVLASLSVGIVIPLINIFFWRPIMKKASAISGGEHG